MIIYIILGLLTFILMLAFTAYAWLKESMVILDVTGSTLKDVFTTYFKDFCYGIKDGFRVLSLPMAILVVLAIVLLYFVLWPIGLCLLIKSYSQLKGYTK